MNYDRTYVNCWSRDGQSLLVTVPAPGMGWDLSVIPLAGDHTPWMFLSTKFDESFASLSPDGKWLAYISNETGTNQLYVRPFPRGDGKWQISTDRSSITSWSSDGKTLYFDSPEGIMGVPITGAHTLTAGQPHVVLKGYRGVQVESAVSYDIATDGQHILVTKPKEGEEMLQQINVVLNLFQEIQNKAVLAK
jgi:Tol biopolymer transport system component